MRFLPLYFVLAVLCNATAQNNLLARLSPEEDAIQLKWYCQPFVTIQGVFIDRMEIGSKKWERLNRHAVKQGEYRITAQERVNDEELNSYERLASDPNNLKDVALLACVIKSFKSDVFSRYLGIRYDDTTFTKGKTYLYRLVVIHEGKETQIASSDSILADHYRKSASPKNIKFRTSKRQVSFVWQPETDRYFGTDIYRRTSESTTYLKLTKTPIVLSKTRNTEGTEAYGRDFFVDQKLNPGQKYVYQFVAIDFFGDESEKSEPIEVLLKDLDAPAPPDSVYKTQKGRVVQIQWKKRIFEKDFAGYQLYRTTRNDTDFRRLSTVLIPPDNLWYTDTVPRFGSYLYKISALDTEGNEAFSNPFFLEIYDDEPPSKPSQIRLVADSGSFHLSWAPNPEEDVAGYLVYRTVNTDNPDAYVKITPTPIVETFFEERQPKHTRNKFLYKVVAVDQSMNKSFYSDAAQARLPDVTAPAAPFLRTVYHTNKGHVSVEWLMNTEIDLAGYRLFRKLTNDTSSKFELVHTKLISISMNRYVDRYTEPGERYSYCLQALDSSGNSSTLSNIITLQREAETGEGPLIKSCEAKYRRKRKQVILKWRVTNEENVKGVVVYKKQRSDLNFSPITGLINEMTYCDRDVVPSHRYEYQLRVYNNQGDVVRSQKMEINTEP